MPTAIPALHGKFGNIEYFLTTMHIGEFVRLVRFPKDVPGWEDLTIEERYQRDINIARIRKQIAPYYAADEYRFSSALVLAVKESENGKMEFEPLSEFGKSSGVHTLYKSAAKEMGFLTLNGGETLIPLDGQHRAKAFKFAIDGADDNNRPIEGMKGNIELADDKVAVILVRFDPTIARRIFNKINRYAKPTTKSDNLITDDDDAMAVMSRELLREEGVIDARLVRIGANTLNKKAPEFTTLATFYDANIAIVKGLGISAKGSPSQMPEEQREVITEDVSALWCKLLERIDLWKAAVADPSQKGDAERIEIREQTLLGKPIGQLSLVRAFMLMRERCEGVSEDELCNRLNRISWDVNETMWRGVLMNPNGRIMSGKNTVNRAAEFIAHLGGAPLSTEETGRLLGHIHGDAWRDNQLPNPVA